MTKYMGPADFLSLNDPNTGEPGKQVAKGETISLQAAQREALEAAGHVFADEPQLVAAAPTRNWKNKQ